MEAAKGDVTWVGGLTTFSSSSAEQLELDDVSSRENSTSTSFFSTEVTEAAVVTEAAEVTASSVITVFDLDLSAGMEDCCHVCVILHICETNLPMEVKLSKIS